ncbi:MAG: YciI family protein [Gemmatimonadota bacterium]
MRFMCLIYDDEKAFASLSDNDRNAVYGEYRQFGEAIEKSGHYVTGSELAPTTTAATVRVRNGKTQTTDGPFAETREQLGGFYIVDAKDMQEAKALAARIPSARTGTIEIRQLI